MKFKNATGYIHITKLELESSELSTSVGAGGNNAPVAYRDSA